MKACGLIVEYNPFHNGHIYHLKQSRKISQADCIIAVMSGSFLQRGEPAIVDKFSRAKAALEYGVDLVLELQYAYSVQSSTLFSHGEIKILNALKIDSQRFGSEYGNINNFINNFDILNNKEHEYNHILKQQLHKGLSYPVASNMAYKTIGFNLDVLEPNNILGFSYTKEILSNNLPIELYTFKRTNNAYHYEIFKNNTDTFHQWENYFDLLQYKVLSSSRFELSKIALIDEGIHNRIKDTARKATSFHHWMHLVKTKRYTWVKIQRIFTHILTSTTQ